MIEITEHVSGDFEEKLRDFAKHMQTTVARVGAQAMAQLVYDSAKQNVPVSGLPIHYFYGTTANEAKPGQKKQHAYVFHSGDLKASIYQVFSKDRSNKTRKVYQIAWNHQKVPYGFMVEFGTANASAHPFLYPAFAAHRSDFLPVAGEAMREALAGGVY